ncbi:phenylalanine--tRNA ligase subunit beta [Benzoatithermus flavus]|uniref:Phenylalanine--tRNA ligase beta subunit n=1 Tax=Benzoatithermus flavus TaxID=3108223 RepID=A0ABU8XZ02_9PROT
MKFTLPWLEEHLETEASLEVLADRLTMLGIEVEGISDPGADLAAFSVGYVREARQHPNADRLRLCTVETKHGTFDVVCGAPNARAGIKVVFAPEGAVIPVSGEVLKKVVIRGVPSVGMLCSARELKLGDDHTGIIELPETAEVGEPAAKALGLEGPVIEVKLTPDRSDCFGVVGIARDLAAAGLGRLKTRNFAPVPSRGPAGIRIDLAFPKGEENACPLFVGRMIRGVRNGPSPAWLQNRLKAIGLRPISALVDITNYLTFDLCRPLHVFDAAKVQGDITLRFARLGEELLALDGRTYRLDDGMTVIADESGPISLGGIMGGESTAVDEDTTDVLLEVALFDPLRTAATGRRLGIESDARTRFERGLDPGLVLPATEYATRLILELCGGEADEPFVAGSVPGRAAPVRFRRSRLARLAGIDLEPAEIERILRSLGFTLEGGPAEWQVTPPSWRHDISTEACIVEELARLHGYDRIPPVPVTRTEAVGQAVLTAEQRRRMVVRRAVAAMGYAEAVTWSFVPPEQAMLFGHEQPILKRNPLNAELSAMRPSLLPNLVAAVARNVARKHEAGALFELGPRFLGPMPGEQVMALAAVRFGAAEPRHWAQRTRPVDAIDAKGDALAALAVLGIKPDSVQVTTDAPAWYHPGRSGCLRQGRALLATFGELHPRVLKMFDLAAVPVVAFELDLDTLPKPKTRATRAKPALEPLPYPPVDRDFAFVVDASVPAGKLLDAVRGVDRRLIRDVRLFDVYAGPNVGEGRKSLAIAVRLQANDRTLTEEEIEAVAGRIVAAAEKATGASLRQ